MGRVANKGMVGLSMRYRDTSLALISAHFASDLRGRSRLTRRNRDACTTLRDLTLLWDSEEFDVHLQHHHGTQAGAARSVRDAHAELTLALLGVDAALLLGDLNYRLVGSPEAVLELVRSSAEREKQLWGVEEEWPLQSYARFWTMPSRSSGGDSDREEKGGTRHATESQPMWARRSSTDDREVLALAEVALHGPALDRVRAETWDWICDLDELEESMTQGQVLSGFFEGFKAFPPTYRFFRMPPPEEGEDEEEEEAGDEEEGRERPSRLVPQTSDVAGCELPDFASVESLRMTYSYGGKKKSRSGSGWGSGWGSGRSGFGLSSGGSFPGSEGSSTRERPPHFLNCLAKKRESSFNGSWGSGTPLQSLASRRTPSYTDRVLTYSLPARQGGLRWLGYDMCAGMDVSDHRPVSAALEVMVDPQARKLGDRPDRMVMMELWMGSARVELDADPSKRGGSSSGRNEPAGLNVLYPLISEDGLAFRRRIAALSHMGSGSLSDGGVESLHRLAWGRIEAEEGIAVEALANPSTSQHALLKLTDAKGNDLGQAVLCVVPPPPLPGQDPVPDGPREVLLELTSGGAHRGSLRLLVNWQPASRPESHVVLDFDTEVVTSEPPPVHL
jgi:uncharacterized membrane protein YgcG